MDMFRDINFKYEKLMNFRKELKNMYDLTGALIEKRKNLIEFNGFSDYDKNRLLSKYNPEDYYSFRLFDKGVSIIYTNYRFDEEIKRAKRTNIYGYSIKYYNCRSKLFEDKRKDIPFIQECNSYGCFDSLDVAISFYKKAVVDVLVTIGHCLALNPLDFM